MNEDLILLKRLEALREKHRDLDDKIKNLHPMRDQLMYMRCKKEKLSLRDEILRLEQVVYPDIIA